MRVALVSTGLGRILRGFESFTEALFKALRCSAPDIDVTLFKGGGKRSDRCVVLPNFHRNDVPSRWLGYEKGNHLEKRSFALALYPILRRGHYDIVHYNELTMGSALYHLRRLFGGKYKLLYCNGAPSPPIHYYRRCDFAQILTKPMFDEARCFGMIGDRLFLIPYGVDVKVFSTDARLRRTETRYKLGIPENAKVVLTVAALKREHKRIDYIIKEVSALDDSVWLLAAGQRTDETPLLEKEAHYLLGRRWKFVSWPHKHMNLLYGAADIFALASLIEAFGLVTIEAMASGLPAVIHESPANLWIGNGTSARFIDMGANGELRRVLKELLYCKNSESSTNEVIRRFSWQALIPQYLDMYQQVAKTGPNVSEKVQSLL